MFLESVVPAAARRIVLAMFVLGCATAFAAEDRHQGKTVFEFQDGDRVVLIGDTLIEREAAYGYVEQRLTTQFPDCHVTFRNLGWSADSPAGESRASFDFDKPGKGFEKIKDQLRATQPTVVIVGYGMASSFDGPDGLEKFRKDLDRLLETIPAANT